MLVAKAMFTLLLMGKRVKVGYISMFQIFTYFTECMKLMIDNAKKEGRYVVGEVVVVVVDIATENMMMTLAAFPSA